MTKCTHARAVALFVALSACTPQPVFPPPDADASPPAPTLPVVDGAPLPIPDPGNDACGHAYQHLVAAGCVPVPPQSGSWVDVCRVDRQNGLFALKCINTVMSVYDAEKRCGVTCLPH